MAVNDVVLVKCEYRGAGGERCYNLLHYVQLSGVGSIDASNAAAAAAVFEAQLAPHLMNVASVSATWGQIEMTVIKGVNINVYAIANVSGGLAGSSTYGDGPIERCIVFRKESGMTGRANRGRLYSMQPGAGVFDQQGSYVVGNTDAVAIADCVAALLAPIDMTAPAVGIWNPCTWHRPTLSAVPMFTVTVSSLVGVQRRRRLGIGQ